MAVKVVIEKEPKGNRNELETDWDFVLAQESLRMGIHYTYEHSGSTAVYK